MSPSPMRYRGAWKLHKHSSEADRWLEEMGFYRKRIARDSSCLFRAVSEAVYKSQRYFLKVRQDCVNYMTSTKHLFEASLNCPFDMYMNEIAKPTEWGGHNELSAMSHMYRRDFVIFEANKESQTSICNGYGDNIFLFYTPDTKHFDVVYTKEYINKSSFCQSLVYELLYENIFQMQDIPYAVEKMLYDKLPSNHIEYYMPENVEFRKKQKETAKIFIEAVNDEKDPNNNFLNLKCKHHTKDVDKANLLKEPLSILVFNRSLIHLENICLLCLNVNSAQDLLNNGITPFPYKVAKALDPNIYRNIEFDVWSELQRELRYGARYSDGTTLQVGVKCLCKIQDHMIPYHCHIQEMIPEGPCTVFVEELGEKMVVNYEQLEPLPMDEVKPWAPPYRYSRAQSQFLTISQILQQLGNLSRKQGLSKVRKGKSSIEDRTMSETQISKKQSTQITWNEEYSTFMNPREDNMMFPPYMVDTINFSAYHHLDFVNFFPAPVQVTALPLMVDCRTGAGAGTVMGGEQDKPNGPSGPPTPHQTSPPNDNHHNQGASGDMALVPVSATPNINAPLTHQTYSGMGGYSMNMGVCPTPYMYGVGAMGGYMKGGVMWCPPAPPPPAHPPAQLPHSVNPHVFKSVQANGADLPMNDIATLRYFFNLGLDCAWAGYTPPPAPHCPSPPRHYSHHELAHDMQHVTLQERPPNNHNGPDQNSKHNKPMQNNMSDKHANNQGKGNGQRPLLGPRFKRGGNNQDGAQNMNQNKSYNNTMNNKGPNNRRNSHNDQRPVSHNTMYATECVEPPMVQMPYIPYQPVYPQYYPMEHDTGMVGVISTMGGYVGYDENVEYVSPVPHYYAPPYPPPAISAPPAQLAAPPPHNIEHK